MSALAAFEAPQEVERRFGPEVAPMDVQLSLVNVAGQMRDEFNAEDLEELKDSIRATGLLNGIILYEMPSDFAQEYVDFTNQNWGTNVDFGSYVPNENGNYYILVAGERRYRAISSIIEEDGLSPDAVSVSSQVRTTSSFLDMMGVQVAENVYGRPKAHQYAKILYQIYTLGLEAGAYSGPEDFLREAKGGRVAAKNALTYFELPSYIHELVDAGKFKYGYALAVHPFYVAYRKHLQEIEFEPEELEGQLKDMMESRIAMVVRKGWRKSEIEQKVVSWVDEFRYKQMDWAEHMIGQNNEGLREIERNKLLRMRREEVNSASRSIRGAIEALGIVSGFDAQTGQYRTLDPQMRALLGRNLDRDLRGIGEMLDLIHSAYRGTGLGAYAMALALAAELMPDEAERMTQDQELLEKLDDESIDGTISMF